MRMVLCGFLRGFMVLFRRDIEIILGGVGAIHRPWDEP